jgi:hypothetical protein
MKEPISAINRPKLTSAYGFLGTGSKKQPFGVAGFKIFTGHTADVLVMTK